MDLNYAMPEVGRNKTYPAMLQRYSVRNRHVKSYKDGGLRVIRVVLLYGSKDTFISNKNYTRDIRILVQCIPPGEQHRYKGLYW